MKKLYLLPALLLGICLFSCSSDDDDPIIMPVFQEENTHNNFYSGSSFNAAVTSVGDNVLETGFEFKPKHNGKITKLTVKLAGTDPTVNVTLWDTESREILRTQTVNVSAASTLMEIDIEPLVVTKGHLYTISVETNALFTRTLASGVLFPINVGSIEVVRSVHTDNEFGFPGVDGFGVMYGDAGFKFIRTE